MNVVLFLFNHGVLMSFVVHRGSTDNYLELLPYFPSTEVRIRSMDCLSILFEIKYKRRFVRNVMGYIVNGTIFSLKCTVVWERF